LNRPQYLLALVTFKLQVQKKQQQQQKQQQNKMNEQTNRNGFKQLRITNFGELSILD